MRAAQRIDGRWGIVIAFPGSCLGSGPATLGFTEEFLLEHGPISEQPTRGPAVARSRDRLALGIHQPSMQCESESHPSFIIHMQPGWPTEHFSISAALREKPPAINTLPSPRVVSAGYQRS